MIIITDRNQVVEIADIPLRNLINQRIQEIDELCPRDAEDFCPIIVVEPGDTPDELKTIMGFSVLEGIFDDSHFGDDDFAPAFEFAESHGDQLFELVYIVSDSGYGYDIFILNRPGINPVLLAFCQNYAVPPP